MANDDVINAFFGGSEAKKAFPSDYRCGYVSIVGRPNVGKSTLLNHILGQKLSITSRKPQTTRHRILGIVSRDLVQAIYVDTPGIHGEERKAINRYMNRAATSALRDVDVILFVVDALKWTTDDELVLEKLQKTALPVILVINKVDTVDDKAALLPAIEKLSKRMNFADVLPVSALRGHNVDELHATVGKRLPLSPPFFDEDQITDRSQRFLAAEMVREKIMRQLGEEIPYELTVEIEEFKQEGKLLRISACILVEREGQKKIVIGDGGSRLKLIGTEARLDMVKLFDRKIMLSLWVKVKGGWSDNERALKSLGYSSD
ncbi:GTP-binding protein Era [Paraperlucidibaca baekdonensis]|uniref:GTPase Era n=1 Tax=Paraperlucidibaca baekdonensis TaxID=748120 RepID=A0A3E0H3V8_9GAMM|nr:GTPase Era [Paraperlucidibaca baekdonensis]REH37875.1 GTP-binding protein Era [Paraperlucidibaca baekdonensis]